MYRRKDIKKKSKDAEKNNRQNIKNAHIYTVEKEIFLSGGEKKMIKK